MAKSFSQYTSNVILKAVVPLLMLCVGGISDKSSRRLAGIVVPLIKWLYWPGFRLVKCNLKVAFPDKSQQEISKLASENMLHMAWSWIDFIRLLKNPHKVNDFMDSVEGAELMNDQIILCLPHLGSWELLAQYFPKIRHNCAAVAEVFPYDKLNEVLDKSRSVNGLKLIPREGAVKGVIAELRQGTSIGVLIDQNLSPKHGGIFVNFCGLPVPSSPLPAFMAKKYNVQLISGTCIRLDNGKFKMILSPVTIDQDDDKYTLTQKIISANEKLILDYPEQYTWLYRRWKYIPTDIPDSTKAKYPYYAVEKNYSTTPAAPPSNS